MPLAKPVIDSCAFTLHRHGRKLVGIPQHWSRNAAATKGDHMKRLMFACILGTLFVPSSILAQDNPFLGTWKTNLTRSKYEPGPPPKNPNILKDELSGAD